jgi:hypothetical protein
MIYSFDETPTAKIRYRCADWLTATDNPLGINNGNGLVILLPLQSRSNAPSTAILLLPTNHRTQKNKCGKSIAMYEQASHSVEETSGFIMTILKSAAFLYYPRNIPMIVTFYSQHS